MGDYLVGIFGILGILGIFGILPPPIGIPFDPIKTPSLF
jgi:hypothetical protein